MEDKEKNEEKKTESAFDSAIQKLKTWFPTIAASLVPFIMINDRPDVNFFSLFMGYTAAILLILVPKFFLLCYPKETKSIIGESLYDILLSVFVFIMILYSLLILRLLLVHFSVTMDNLPVIIVIYLFALILIELFIYQIKQIKFLN